MLWKVIITLFATYILASGYETQGYQLNNASSKRTAFRSVAYYTNWSIYARKFYPQDLSIDNLTHVLYAFANISPDTGKVYLSDSWADTQIHFTGDSWNEAGTNLYGCFKQLYLLKKANRNLKVLLSIGGSSYSANFARPASTDSGRSTFVSTAISLVANLGLDGLDINWEFPQSDTEATNMVLLLKTLREALNAYGSSLRPSYDFQLSVACPAYSSYYQTLHLADMDPYIDFWNLIAFDYAGNWSNVTSNQANLFFSASNPASTPFNTEDAVHYYIFKGIAANKIVLGMPLYGRSFAATEGFGQPFNGVGLGTWEAGVYDFKALPLRGTYDNTTGSSYVYNATRKELISYDDINATRQKATYIRKMGLGGAMWWESSADRAGNESLVQNAVEILRRGDDSMLESSLNRLLFPNSTYENLRVGMPALTASVYMTTTSLPTALSISPAANASLVSISISTSVPESSVTYWTTITINTTSSTLVSANSMSEAVANISVSATTSVEISTQASTDKAMVPGENGVPGCAYVLASNFMDAACSLDYCNCGGTIAPLLISSVSGTLKRNCNYQTQPAANSCPSVTSSAESTTGKLEQSSITTSALSFSSTSSSTSSTPSSVSNESSGSGCIAGDTCGSYNIVTCPSGSCFCGIDVDNNPTCFGEYTCLKSCTTNDDCSEGEACLIKSCCSPKKENCNLHNFLGCHIYTGGSTCAPLATGC